MSRMAKLRTFVMLPYESKEDATIGYDMKEIVRCSECRYKNTCIRSLAHDDPEKGFCAWGEGEQE